MNSILKIGTSEFTLTLNGVTEREKSRIFTIESEATYTEIESAFSDVSSVQCCLESGTVIASYLDGISVKSIKRDYDSGIYTIEISTDAVITELRALKALITSQ